jgi:phage terminase large subunit-like protein
MGRRKKTIEELKRSGSWDRRTKAWQAARLAAEAPLSFQFGAPPIPEALSPRECALWTYYCEALLERRLLAKTDGPLIMEILRAKSLEDDEALAKCIAILEARDPFPPDQNEPTMPVAQQRVAPDAAAVAKAYAVDVQAGVIVACKFVKLACKRFLADLARTDMTFDSVAAQHVVNYITRLGLDLLPWQVFVLANLFGFKLPSGLRRFRYALVLVAKKNGKTALSAALGLYMADPAGDAEPYSSCFCAATTKYQSHSLCFKAACRLRNENQHIAGATREWKSKSSITWETSSFESLAANSEKLNGLNIHFGVLDELGDHVNSSLHNVFTSSTTGRKQPLIMSITTAGETREQIAYEQRNRAAQVLEGVLPGNSFFAYIAELDQGDSPENESVWIKANPSLGILVPIENIRDLAQQAAAIPSTKRAFLRYSFNVWNETSDIAWINYADLEAKGCAYLTDEDKLLTPSKRIAATEARLEAKPLPDLSKLSDIALRQIGESQRTCYGGLDLAIVEDLSAFALLFTPAPGSNIWECIFRVFCPEEGIIRRSKESRVPYDIWRDSKFLIATPGTTTDFGFIRGEILALRQKYRIKEVGFDRALAQDLAKSLETAGQKMVQVTQGFSLSPAILRIERLIVSHQLALFGNPLANWCFSNVNLIRGYKGDVRLDKGRAREKIDLATAACIAMYVAIQNEPLTGNERKSFEVKYI